MKTVSKKTKLAILLMGVLLPISSFNTAQAYGSNARVKVTRSAKHISQTVKPSKQIKSRTKKVLRSDSYASLQSTATKPVSTKKFKGMATPTLEYVSPLQYTEIFNGYGQLLIDEINSSVFLSPMQSTYAGETHAGLAVSKTDLNGDYSVNFTMNTSAQLRTGTAPNPWEVGWFVFGYKPDGTFKYLILKPNGYGIELGESLGNDVQNFLWTSHVGDDSFNIGQSYNVTLQVSGSQVIVIVDGVEKLRYTMTAKDRLSANGRFGFYSEDAAVTFSGIRTN